MFWLWKIAKTQRAEAFISHMDDSFGDGHLSQTVLPNTVSYFFKKKTLFLSSSVIPPSLLLNL